MAKLFSQALTLSTRRNVLFNSMRAYSRTMADPMEHATGLEKRELLAKAAGNDNPFDMKIFKRGPGTKDNPTLVPSAFDSRIIGCVCEEESASVCWMWLYEGEPKRCGCGYWFKLQKKAPL